MSRKIILNRFIVFEPEKKRITGKGRTVIISASASLCLELLIDNVGEVVKHQDFFEYVWRRFGTEPAPTSLYQNISGLRRALNKAGMNEDIIRTLPRKGFLLSPQTTILKEDISAILSAEKTADYSKKLTSAEISENSNADHSVKNITPEYVQNKKSILSVIYNCLIVIFRYFLVAKFSMKIVMMILLISTLLVVFYVFFAKNYLETDNAVFIHSINYKGCSIFSKSDAFLSTDDVMKKAEQLELECDVTPYVYLTFYKNADRLSYFNCQHPLNTGVVANCRSFYYIKNFNDE
ncbi:winged helix-turn-helix domain-containing protein [Pantoea stewartii]|uniref:winged helix-turn-helix domain-containing protein n=1 Tax=Pantoea stewartii TaxID=66269 RepID=UPI0023F7115D|nr:winged helix-turn-helix domain-containing protein [Pantoea stewartii]MDF7788596.1 winged helix-turn-helix domain-containing protein [Pantoea stewartii]